MRLDTTTHRHCWRRSSVCVTPSTPVQTLTAYNISACVQTTIDSTTTCINRPCRLTTKYPNGLSSSGDYQQQQQWRAAPAIATAAAYRSIGRKNELRLTYHHRHHRPCWRHCCRCARWRSSLLLLSCIGVFSARTTADAAAVHAQMMLTRCWRASGEKRSCAHRRRREKGRQRVLVGGGEERTKERCCEPGRRRRAARRMRD